MPLAFANPAVSYAFDAALLLLSITRKERLYAQQVLSVHQASGGRAAFEPAGVCLSDQ